MYVLWQRSLYHMDVRMWPEAGHNEYDTRWHDTHTNNVTYKCMSFKRLQQTHTVQQSSVFLSSLTSHVTVLFRLSSNWSKIGH